MVKTPHLLAVLLAVLVGLVAYNTFVDKATTDILAPAQAAGGGAAGGTSDLIVTPVSYQTGTEALAVFRNVSGRGGGSEWKLAVYTLESGRSSRRAIALNSIRLIEHDVTEILELNLAQRDPSGESLRDRAGEEED